MALNQNTISRIHRIVDLIFDRVNGSVFGPKFIHPRLDKDIYISFKPHLSIPGIYTLSAMEETALPNEKVLETLVNVTHSYIEAQRHATKGQIITSINEYLDKAKQKGIKTNLKTALEGELAGLFGKVRDNVVKIVSTESNAAKNLGTLEGIVKINSLNGIEDPVVAFIGPNDSNVCEECKRVLYYKWPVPKVFKLSEVKSGWHKRGEDTASMYGMHPQCRHSLITIMPGFGFDKAGKLKYFNKEYREFNKQNS